MKKVIAWLLVLALTAAVSIGATLAYLTDTDEDVNVMTLGKVKIDQLEYERIDDESQNENAEVQEFRDNKPLYPAITEDGFDYTPGASYVDWTQIGKDGYTSDIWDPTKINNEIDKMVFVKNKGDYDAYVRTVFAFEAGNYETKDQFLSMVHLNLNETDWEWEWLEEPVTIGESKYFIAAATYNKVLEPGAYTEISLSQISLDKTATNEDVKAFGETYQVLVKSQGIQADGFETAALALDEGFGVIDADNVPFETDSPTKGIDLKTAIHYYEGDASSQITDKVTSVTFGLSKDYANITSAYDATLVDVGQDIPAYAYYVPNGDNYDVYCLSNSDIYLPENSERFFQDMTALVSVNSDNLNTSRAKLMNHLFLRCYALEDVDVNGWDTSNVTNMRSMFNYCSSLTSLDVTGLNTSNVTDISFMFYRCTGLKTLDVTGLDTSNVTTMEKTFGDCYEIEEIKGVTDLDLSSNTSLYCTFRNAYKLETIDLTGWDTSKVTIMHDMFVNCSALTTVKGTGTWNTSNVTNMVSLFNGCQALVDPGEIGNWDTSKVESMRFMFYNCKSLTELNVADWDTGNVTEMNSMFKGCKELVDIDLSKWDTGKVVNFNSMFSSYGSNTGDMKLKTAHLENWDTSSAETMGWMFYGCGSVEEMDLSKWDVSNVTTFYHLFADCYNLKTVNLTDWDTSSAVDMNGMFNDCHSLTVLDLSDLDTANVTDIGQMFEGCNSLTEIIGMSQWDTSSLQSMGQMFNYNGTTMQIREVDLSGWDTSNVKWAGAMFNGCKNLTTVYVGDGWDMSNVEDSGYMFASCGSIVGGNGTTYDSAKTDVTYARVDQPAQTDAEGNVITEAVPGYLTYKAAE